MSSLPATDLIPVRCPDCKAMFAVPVPQEGQLGHEQMDNMARSGRIRCETCDQNARGALEAATILARENARLTSWNTFCPDEFKKPIEWGRASAKRENMQKLEGWQFQPTGFLIMGGPGRCKSRFVWRLLDREWNINGRKINALGHTEFRYTVSALAASDSHKMLQWITGLGKVEILFIDDLGKGRATPASEEGLHDLLDLRYRTNLPTLYTSNLDPAQIEASFSPDYGQGIIRRILDTCQKIQF